MKRDLLTTGEAAKLCGVTYDAVLKWIKKGKLRASRTTGGHFRVARQSLEALGQGDERFPNRPAGPATPRSVSPSRRCWEYYGHDAELREACQKCVVYRARIEKCYEVADLGETIGHSRKFCQATCGECSFFRACKGLASAVLVVSDDEAMIDALTAEADPQNVVLRFARCGYESSSLVETFRPSIVIMDSNLPEVREGRLVDSIANDPRLPGLKVVVALRQGHEMPSSRGEAVIPAPLSIEKIDQLVRMLEPPACAMGNVVS